MTKTKKFRTHKLTITVVCNTAVGTKEAARLANNCLAGYAYYVNGVKMKVKKISMHLNHMVHG